MCRHNDAGAIFGNTLEDLEAEKHKHLTIQDDLEPADYTASYTDKKAWTYSPYPDYNEKSWHARHAPHVPCKGPFDQELPDVHVYQGHPKPFPDPSFGSYAALGMDGNLCYERQTRLGPYGYQQNASEKPSSRWSRVNWGQLQNKCVEMNKARYDTVGSPNPFMNELLKRGNEQPASSLAIASATSRHSIRLHPTRA